MKKQHDAYAAFNNFQTETGLCDAALSPAEQQQFADRFNARLAQKPKKKISWLRTAGKITAAAAALTIICSTVCYAADIGEFRATLQNIRGQEHLTTVQTNLFALGDKGGYGMRLDEFALDANGFGTVALSLTDLDGNVISPDTPPCTNDLDALDTYLYFQLGNLVIDPDLCGTIPSADETTIQVVFSCIECPTVPMQFCFIWRGETYTFEQLSVTEPDTLCWNNGEIVLSALGLKFAEDSAPDRIMEHYLSGDTMGEPKPECYVLDKSGDRADLSVGSYGGTGKPGICSMHFIPAHDEAAFQKVEAARRADSLYCFDLSNLSQLVIGDCVLNLADAAPGK